MSLNPELLAQAKSIAAEKKRIEKFGARHNVVAPVILSGHLYRAQQLHESINDKSPVSTLDELWEAELKRQLAVQILTTESRLSGRPWTFQDTLQQYCMSTEDVRYLLPWLIANRPSVLNAAEQLYNKQEVNELEYSLPVDVPRIRSQALGFAESKLRTYHRAIGELFGQKTGLGEYLYRIEAEVTSKDRSYFNAQMRRLCLSLGGICFEREDGTIQLNTRELLRLYGHEGMGHALQSIITSSSDELPFFIQDHTGLHSISAEEAVAQYFEQRIFDDLLTSPATQQKLGIKGEYSELYQEEKATRVLEEYLRRLSHYAITVLADKSMGDPEDPQVIQKRIDLISEVALYPSQGRASVEAQRHNYDRYGNINRGFASEIRYASATVETTLGILRQSGLDYSSTTERGRADLSLLTGYLTPKGLIERAQIISRDLRQPSEP